MRRPPLAPPSRRTALGLILGTSALLAASALAQDEAEDESYPEDLVLEEVIVTGTRIVRRDFSSPSPLTTISREDIEFSGQPTLEDYMNQMPQLAPITGRAVNNGSDGTAALDLRNMGPGRTLVMLNGRRLAPSGEGSAVDVNTLPSTLIERVELITGGASTVYGSDAIAGVVNFITRDDFEGLSFEGGYNVTEEGDADIWDANVVFGHALANGGHITAYAGRYERETLFASERERTRMVWTDYIFTGELLTWGSQAIPAGRISGPRVDLGNGPVQITFNPDGTPRAWHPFFDLYNFQPVNYLQTPQSRDTLGVLGQIPVGDASEFYFEASYAQNDVQLTLAPSPFFGFLAINTDNPSLTPEAAALFSRPEFELEPGLAGFALSRRLLELGPRIGDFDKTYQRYVVGLRGDFAGTWSYDTWLTYTDFDEKEFNRNDASRSRIQQGLLVNPATGECFDPSGGCVPVNLFGEGNLSDAAVDFIRAEDYLNTTSRQQWLASAVVTGAPFEIWSGPVDMAFGIEYRSDEAQFLADEGLFSGDTVGFGGDASINGKETVYELYSEAVMTLFEGKQSSQKLDLEVGARWSDYDNAGSVTTWKAGLDWRVTDSLRFRTMLQHAVRAPNNSELFTEQFIQLGSFIGNNAQDPCSASQDPVGSGNADKCISQGLSPSQLGVFEATRFYPTTFISGGNPNLEPESSDTFTLGFVVNPDSIPELTIAVDYWDIEVTDTIGGVSAQVVCFDPLNTTGVFCDRIQRDATGNVVEIRNQAENRGLLATDGVDVQLRYQTDLPDWLSWFDDIAQLSVNATLTHVMSLKTQENIVSQVFECEGKFGFPCGGNLFGAETIPENRFTANFNYGSGPFNAHLTWRWIDGTTNAAPIGLPLFGITEFTLAIPEIAAWNYFDLGLSYNWDDAVTVRFGVNNLFDKESPLMADWAFNNTDTKLYDVFGRTFYLNLRYQITGD